MRTLFLLFVIAAALGAASYAGARFTAGKVIGPKPQGLGSSSARFAFDGIRAIQTKPRGWIISYPNATGFGRGGGGVYLSPTGQIPGPKPAHLGGRRLPRGVE